MMTSEARKREFEKDEHRRGIEAATRMIERRREVTRDALCDVFGDVTMAEADAFLNALEDRGGAVVVIDP